MDRGTRIRGDKRQRASQAYERWKGFQPNLREIRGAEANRDGSIPRPRVGVLTFEQRARFAERERLREVVESPLYRNARITAERMIGATLDFTDLAPNEQARKAGRPVVRIVMLNGNGFVPEGFTLFSYAVVQAVAQGIERAGTDDPMKVAEALKNGEPISTVVGQITFDEKGDIKDATYDINQWHDGQYAPIKP
jgi:hypothetical protein